MKRYAWLIHPVAIGLLATIIVGETCRWHNIPNEFTPHLGKLFIAWAMAATMGLMHMYSLEN